MKTTNSSDAWKRRPLVADASSVETCDAWKRHPLVVGASSVETRDARRRRPLVVGASSVEEIPSSSVVIIPALYSENPQPLFMERNKYIYIKGSKLPHWHQTNKVQFVTFRLADSLPQKKLLELSAFRGQWLEEHPQPWNKSTQEEYNREIRKKVDRWLDQGCGECLLGRKEIREIVIKALLFYHGKRYTLHHFVIMPNHVHLLLSPIGDDEVTKSIGSVKQFSANAINRLLGRNGNIWQRNEYDHLVRDMQGYVACINYINQNPRNLLPEQYSIGVNASSVE